MIKKTSPEYAAEKNPPPCPSVMVDNRFIALNDTVTFEAIRDAILSGGGSASGAAGSHSG